MNESDNDLESFTPPDISEMAKEISLDLLPRKSKMIYEKKYEEFMVWCIGKGVKKVSEDVLLSYFSLKAKVMKSPSLWSLFSMIKATLKVKHDIDIKGFHKLMTFLKVQSVGYKPQKSKTFSEENLRKFLLQAPDVDFLMKKVVLIFAITGACRMDELVKMTTDNVEDKTNVLIVTVPDSKTNKGRVFIITNNNNINPTLDYLAMCKQYFMLRPNKPTTNRLFLNYKKGVCTNQVVGMNTIAKIPSDVANYLGLPEPSQYTGHCFRRTSAALLRKRKKEYGSPTNESSKPGCNQDNSSSSLPMVLTSECSVSAQERNHDDALKNDMFKEELILEDYGDPDERMEYPIPEQTEENEDIVGNKGIVTASVLPSGGIVTPFEYVMCGSSDVKIKQEVLESESDYFSSHGVDTTPTLPALATVEESAECLSLSSDSKNLLFKMTTKVQSLLNKSQKQIMDEDRAEKPVVEVPAARLEKCQICVSEIFTSRSDLVQHCILKHSDGSSSFSPYVKPSGKAIDKPSSQNPSILVGGLDTTDPLVLCETTLTGCSSATTPSSYNSATTPSYNTAISAGYRAATTAGYSDATSAGYRAATTAGYRAVTTPGYRAATTAGYRAVTTPGYRAATTPGYRAATTAGYRAATTAGCSAATSDTTATTTPTTSIGCDICEEIFAIIPEESRKATMTKILELVRLISDENVNPELVKFSVMKK